MKPLINQKCLRVVRMQTHLLSLQTCALCTHDRSGAVFSSAGYLNPESRLIYSYNAAIGQAKTGTLAEACVVDLYCHRPADAETVLRSPLPWHDPSYRRSVPIMAVSRDHGVSAPGRNCLGEHAHKYASAESFAKRCSQNQTMDGSKADPECGIRRRECENVGFNDKLSARHRNQRLSDECELSEM